METIICNVCESPVSSILARKDGHDVYRCSTCGLAFTHPQPGALADQYDERYFELYRKRRKFRLKRAEARLRRIELIRAPGRLLDIGSSLGYFVEAASARGWRASGVEISPYAAEEARKMGLDVHTGVLGEAGFPDESFDCVTMWDVLEHVPDPSRHMLEVRGILAEGGLAVIGTPDLGHPLFRLKRERWRHLKPAEHLFYFRRSSITRLLEKTGFKTIRPPVVGGRRFAGSRLAALSCMVSGLAQPNDVMVVYGLKR